MDVIKWGKTRAIEEPSQIQAIAEAEEITAEAEESASAIADASDNGYINIVCNNNENICTTVDENVNKNKNDNIILVIDKPI
jgi:hypothetical protein